ncbi:MAG TPA: AI-2E family transporter [Acidimicrobiia bacterium]|nr:AI-2E family transporter [Acidimicrobiia bacterium]
MADASRMVPSVRVSLRSALTIVVALAATILVLEVATDAKRVIAWALSAAAIAALVYPAVEWLAHFRLIPKAAAVLITVLVVLGSLGFIGYRIVNDVSNATSSLQDAAPARAAELERSSDFFREIELKRRVTALVNQVPKRLAGGDTTEVLRSAASRTLAFLAGTILTIFFVLYGAGLISGALNLISDDERRRRVETVVKNGSRRALFFARVKLWESVVEALLAFAIARAAGVPGPAALAVWVGLWSLLPVAGVLIGALPIIVFAGAHSFQRALVVSLIFAAIGAADWWINRWLERRSVDVGSFAIVLAAFAGLELYGLTGALLFVLGAIFVVAIVSEVGPEEVAEAIAEVAANPVETDDDYAPGAET